MSLARALCQRRRAVSFASVAAATLLAVVPARADTKMGCLTAASDAQTLRDAHRLVAARDQFRACAQRDCPAVVQEDCGRWLAEVEKSLPTVVFTAKDESGALLADVTVTEDGRTVSTKMDGIALPMDPGAHTLRFAMPNGASAEVKAIVVEGEPHQSVSATIRVVAPAAFDPAARNTSPANAEPVTDRSTPVVVSPVRTVGWVAVGVGGVGLVLGGVFGGVTFADKASAHCDAAGFCDASPLHAARSAATLSTVGLVAGAGLGALGAALLLFVPSGGRGVAITPTIGRAETGLLLTEVW